MLEKIKNNRKGIVRMMFLIPIILVMVISISHVVSWYDLANPLSWAIYLSIAIEIAAMSAISASSIRIKGFSVWFVFIIVTLVQFMGNIFFSYSDIDITTKSFKDWSELTAPVFDSLGSDTTDLIAQRRWLALLEGGLLPLISLTCLHFFIRYGDIDNIEVAAPNVVSETVVEDEPVEEISEPDSEAPKSDPIEPTISSPEEKSKPPVQAVPFSADAQISRTGQLSHKMKKILSK